MRTRSIPLRRHAWLVVLAAALVVTTFPVRGADKRIVLLAGRPSHGPGMHEFRAGSMLLQKALTGFPGATVEVYTMGCPTKAVDGKTGDANTPPDNTAPSLI